MNGEDIYKNIMASSNSAKIAFIAITTDILKSTKVKDKEITVLRNKLSKLLWEWQEERDIYLNSEQPKTKEQCKILYSYKIYLLVDRIYNRCFIHGKESVENTICAVLYDVCLFSTWFLASIEGYYLGRLPKIFASDIADVDIGYINDIVKKAAKRNDSYLQLIFKTSQYLKNHHPISNVNPLGKPITKKEIENILR
jgi:hypothetical protein